ncbi:hypothetical protein [Sorangium sp. So ce204]
MALLMQSRGIFFAPNATGANRAMGELRVTGNVNGPKAIPADQRKAMELQNQQIEEAVTAAGVEGMRRLSERWSITRSAPP